MNDESGFTGFSSETIKFYRDLAKDNSRTFFEKNRSGYENFVMKPSRNFVIEMGERMGKIAFDLHADPRVDRSIFRIYRDSRFSRDKTPYKTHLAIWFWDGPGKRMESSGYYFHLEPGKLMLGAGMYMFPDYMLKGYRDAVSDEKFCNGLHKAVSGLLKKKYSIGEKHYKKIPRGYDREYRYADYLLFNGLHAGIEADIPDELFSDALIDYCLERFRDMYPLHKWLCNMIDRLI